MSYIQRYLQNFTSDLHCNESTKKELLDEFHDHLMLLKKEYLKQGLSEENAEKCAVFDFGEQKMLQRELEKTITPFNKIMKYILWLSFCLYIWFVVMVSFIGKFDVLAHSDIGDGVTLRFYWGIYSSHNLIPFYNIHQDIIQSIFWVSNRNGFDITFFSTVLGGMLLFIPLGFYLPTLFRINTIGKTVVYTLLVGIVIEIVQFLTNTGSLNINDALFYVCGTIIGWLIYSFIRNLKLARYEKIPD